MSTKSPSQAMDADQCHRVTSDSEPIYPTPWTCAASENSACILDNAGRTTKLHGTGMGLRISRSIIESHNGRLWAVSTPGGGATFQLSCPRRRPQLKRNAEGQS
jgi:hypothetical protein